MDELGHKPRLNQKNSHVLAVAKCEKAAKMLLENPGMLLGTATKHFGVTGETYLRYAKDFNWPIPEIKKNGGYDNTFGAIGLRK